jgi:hypothetical protein
MTNHSVLIQEIENLPPDCIKEVVDFVVWIKQQKSPRVPETMLLSEAALSKDWNTSEEDEAWKNL